MTKPSSYAEAGVDRDKEKSSLDRILETIDNTSKIKGDTPTGHFAGGIVLNDNVLSLATDGVGSKILLAEEFDTFDTIGIDCVAMNVNDLIATGSIPVSFVDYIAIREPDEEKLEQIVRGLVNGCNQADTALVGGETAVLPEVIAGQSSEFDLAGTALGITPVDDQITGSKIAIKDKIIGISSSGIHSNGLTLARKVLENHSSRRQLLEPTRIYVKAIKELLKSTIEINGMAHITGGGITNLSRLGTFHYNLNEWEIPEIFNIIQQEGNIDRVEMFKTFNMGVGFVVIVAPENEESVLTLLNEFYETKTIGTIEEGNMITIDNLVITGE